MRRRRYTLLEVAEASESEAMDSVLADAGGPAVDDDGRPLVRREFSELQPFDRASFDIEAYNRALGKG